MVAHLARRFEHDLPVVARTIAHEGAGILVHAPCTGSSRNSAGNPQDPALASPRPVRSSLM